MMRLRLREGRPPLGALFTGIGALASAAVVFLRLDRLPFSTCVFKSLTGLPCPTCGSTRALGRLAVFDPSGALAMNPLAAIAAGVLVVWGISDLALLPFRRTLGVEVRPGLAFALRVLVLVLFFVNWVYLLAAGR